MWMPTHVQVTVQKSTDLLIKGKHNTNDCFVTIALGKTKYQTSVKEKAGSSVEWFEECELLIPEQGNRAELILTALHRNFVGIDEFLGRVVIPLNELDVYERPRNRWYTLTSKPGKESKHKNRGQLEVRIAFTVKSGSLTDLSKKEKHKSSVGQLSQMAHSVGGSLLSITSMEKRKGIKKFAKSIGSKMHLKSKKKDADNDDISSIGSVGSLSHGQDYRSKQTIEDADPGVVSDDDDFTFDDLSHKSSGSSLNQSISNSGVPASTFAATYENVASGESSAKQNIPPIKPPRLEPRSQDEWDLKLSGKQTKNLLKVNGNDPILNRRSWESPKLSARIEEEEVLDNQLETQNESTDLRQTSPVPILKKEEKESMLSKLKKIRKGNDRTDGMDTKQSKFDKFLDPHERIIIGGENEVSVPLNNSRISNELLQKFDGKSREDLILSLYIMQGEVDHYRKKLSDLEDYLDELLLRVMETTPKILQNPYTGCKMTNSKIM